MIRIQVISLFELTGNKSGWRCSCFRVPARNLG